MAADATTVGIRDERGENRYGAYLDGWRVGHAARVLVRKTVVLPHVRVGAAGIGSLLLRACAGERAFVRQAVAAAEALEEMTLSHSPTPAHPPGRA